MFYSHTSQRHKGFSVIEIVLCLAIFLIIMLSILQYVSTLQQSSAIYTSSHTSGMQAFSYGEYACDIAKKDLHIESQIVLDFLSTSTIITSVHRITPDVFVLTTDSASTSEADVFKIRIQQNQVEVLDKKDIGPGVQDSVLLYPYLYVANTSINSHVKVLNIYSDISEIQSVRIDSLNRSGSMPRKISIFEHSIMLGSEKSSTGPELFMFEILQAGTIKYTGPSFELGGQAHASKVMGTHLLTANSADPELRVFDIELSLYTSYDAPLTLGNGKSVLNMYPYVLLGRTLGSEELTSISISTISTTSSISTLVVDTARTYGTVDSLERVGRDMIVAFTGNQNKEMQFWHLDSAGRFMEKNAVDLPGRVSAHTCTENVVHVYTSVQEYPTLIILNQNI